MAKHLTSLLKKNLFQWTPTAAQEAFEQLKQAMVSTPILKMPILNYHSLETDASDGVLELC